MRNIKVLHLASFDGNIGDNANHFGFYKNLDNNKNFNFDIEKLEIREFYWKQRFFDDSFVILVNQYDLLVIGGGNYLELWVDDSPTGTSIAIELDLLRRLDTPIFLNALGVDPGQGVSSANLSKFRNFVDALIARGDFISVRNDGAFNTLGSYLGKEYLEHVVRTPDAGFFVEVETLGSYYGDKNYIAINLASDMEEVRFDTAENKLSYSEYLAEFKIFIENFLSKFTDYEIVFVPHIFRDISVISDLLLILDDDFRRRKVSVAPLLHGDESFKQVMNIYGEAKLVLASRFHANVCSMGLGVPVIGLVNYIQIEAFYREIDNNSMIHVTKTDFHSGLGILVEEMLQSDSGKEYRIRDRMQADYDSFMGKFSDWAKSSL